MKILNFFLRMVYGAVGIQIGNMVLSFFGISVSVGLNFVSLLTVGTFGFSGVSLLYAVAAFAFL